MSPLNLSYKLAYLTIFLGSGYNLWGDAHFLTLLKPRLTPRLPQKGVKYRNMAKLNVIIEFIIQISISDDFFRFWLQFVGRCAFLTLLTPRLTPRLPQKGVKYRNMAKMNVTIEFLIQISISDDFFRFSLQFVGRWAFLTILTPRLTPRLPQKGSNIEIWQK